MRLSIHFPRLWRAAGLFVGAIFVVSSIATAEPTYTLKLHATPGEKWAFDLSSGMKQKGQATVNGQQQPLDREITSHRKGTAEVVAVENGMPSVLRITFSADCTNTGNVGGQPIPPCTLAGKTVTVRKENGATTNDLADQSDQMAVQEANHMIEPDMSIYPKTAVAVNQDWEGDPTALASALQLAPTDKINIKCKLLAVKEVDGREVADIGLSGQVVKLEQGFVETRMTLGGVSRLDIKTGQPMTGDVIGKLTIRNLAVQGAPPNVTVQADGEIQNHQIITAIGGPGPAPAPLPVAPTPANPLPPGDAPLYAGSYKGEQLQLDLKPDDSGYTGTLTVAGKPYPVSAKAEANKLVGTFESGGTKFGFAASLEGANLTLTSEGDTYTLKKAAANPLARPAPKNPLAQ